MAKKSGLKVRLNRLWRQIRGSAWQWRNRSRLAAAHQPAQVVWFAMPLISRRRAADWDGVEERLSVTLASLMAQDDPRWHLTICGQDRPSVIPDDPRIRFLKAEISDRFNDQREKGELMTRDLAARGTGAGYYFKLDADDILHPGLVGFLLKDDNRRGYLIDKGYILDAGHLEETGDLRLAPLFPRSPEQPDTQPFYETCGSCAAFWFDLTTGADWVALLDKRGSHHQLETNLADFGFAMQRVPFPAAIYVTNHGNNMRERRGKIDYMISLVDAGALPDPAPVAESFRLRALPGFAGR